MSSAKLIPEMREREGFIHLVRGFHDELKYENM